MYRGAYIAKNLGLFEPLTQIAPFIFFSNLFSDMVRTYKRKTIRALVSEEVYRAAIREVLKSKKSVRATAAKYGLKRATLQRRVNNILRLSESNRTSTTSNNRHNDSDSGNSSSGDDLTAGLHDIARKIFNTQQVFTDAEEMALENYFRRCSKMNFGLTYVQARDLAFEFAQRKTLKIPKQWKNNKTAGVEWMRSFMLRHLTLTLRTPENTSIARSNAFNKTNVDLFFANYSSVIERYKFQQHRIYNLDETGITTVLHCPKVHILHVHILQESPMENVAPFSSQCQSNVEALSVGQQNIGCSLIELNNSMKTTANSSLGLNFKCSTSPGFNKFCTN